MKRIARFLFLALLAFLIALPVHATVSSETTRVKYTCDGATTVYAYPFKIYENDDILAVKALTSTGAETTLVLNTNYTVSGAGGAGGNVTLTAGSVCGSGYTLTILRNIELTQETDYVDGQAFSAESLENAIDKVTLIQQQQEEKIGRAPKLPKTSSITDIALPNPSANNYIGWNAGATNLENKAGPVATTATQYEVDALISYGGGTAYTKATIDAALTAIGTTNKVTLLLRPGTWVISSNADWSAYTNVTFKIVPGAVISHGAFTVNIPNAPTDAMYKWLDGSGLVTFSGQRGKVTPQIFGAVGDDSTDDTAAFQYAINSARSNVVFIPKAPVAYKITTTLNILITTETTDHVSIQGVGMGSKINWRGGNGTSVLKLYGASNGGFYGQTVIEKLWINNANSATTLTGISLGDVVIGETAGTANVTIDNVAIHGMSKVIDLGTLAIRTTISNNWIYNYGTQGVYLTNGSNIRVINNTFQTGAAGSLAVNIQAGTAITISNNYMSGEDSRAVYLSGGAGFSVTDNYIEMPYLVGGGNYAIRVEGMTDGYIGGNQMGGFSEADLIWIDSTSKNVQIGPNHHSLNGTDVASLVKIEAGATGISITAPQNTTGTVTTITGAEYLLYNAKVDRVQIPIFNSLGGATANYVNVENGATTTLFATVAGSAYLVFINQSVENYGAAGVVYVAVGGTTAELFKTGSTNAALQLAVSGLNVQAYNNAGGTRTVYFTALRIY